MDVEAIAPFDPDGHVNVIVETPKGSRHKYKFDREVGAVAWDKVLPQGHVFPFDFGFVPRTVAGDGDPLDVLVLLDEPVFPGCLVKCRLIGAIEARQTVKGRTSRNDRLVAAPLHSIDFGEVKRLSDLHPPLLRQIKQFFVSYNEAQGRQFKPLRDAGPEAALKLVKQAIKAGA